MGKFLIIILIIIRIIIKELPELSNLREYIFFIVLYYSKRLIGYFVRSTF
nr:MAG TPA: hypothetical protein [Caudoviricetes sp.]